jgi:hypothetical protein
MLPSRRTIEARCPISTWSATPSGVAATSSCSTTSPARRPDIRISVHSDDLLKIASGELPFSRAGRLQPAALDASMAGPDPAPRRAVTAADEEVGAGRAAHR